MMLFLDWDAMLFACRKGLFRHVFEVGFETSNALSVTNCSRNFLLDVELKSA